MLKWFRNRAPYDPIKEQLKDIENSGHVEASIAHFISYVLVIFFSFGGLIAVASESINEFITSYNHGTFNIIASVTFAVSLSMIIGLDYALLWAARAIQTARERGQQWTDYVIHLVVLTVVPIIDAATFFYMSWLYDKPTNSILMAILIGRAVVVPPMIVYLRMAKTPTRSPGDIIYQIQRAKGEHILRAATARAQDPHITLTRSAAEWRAIEKPPKRHDERIAAWLEEVDKTDAERNATQYAIAAQPTKQLPPALQAAPVTSIEIPAVHAPRGRHPSEPISWQETTQPQMPSARPGLGDNWTLDQWPSNPDNPDDDDPDDDTDPAATGVFPVGNRSRKRSRDGASRLGSRGGKIGARNSVSSPLQDATRREIRTVRKASKREAAQEKIEAIVQREVGRALENGVELTSSSARRAVDHIKSMGHAEAKRLIGDELENRGLPRDFWTSGHADDYDEYATGELEAIESLHA